MMRSHGLVPDPALAATRRRLADAVVAESLRLVALAGEGAWSAIPRSLARRRARLAALERAAGSRDDLHTLAAVQAAVVESERLLAWVVPTEGGRHH